MKINILGKDISEEEILKASKRDSKVYSQLKHINFDLTSIRSDDMTEVTFQGVTFETTILKDKNGNLGCKALPFLDDYTTALKNKERKEKERLQAK